MTTDTTARADVGAALAAPHLEVVSRASRAREAIVAGVAFVAAVVAAFGPWSPLWRAPGATAVATIAAVALLFVVLVGGYLGASVGAVTGVLHARVRRHARFHAGVVAGPAVLWAVVVLYGVLSGLELLPRAAAFAAYVFVPALLVAGRATPPGRFPVREVAAVAVLWLPIELRLLPPLPVPAPAGWDAARLVGLVNGLFLFLAARPLPGVGYTFALSRRDVATAVAAFLAFAVVAVPVGLATGFIAWHPRLEVSRVLVTPLLIYVGIALPEEFLFRGLIQNLLARWCGAARALPIAAVIFGLAHLPDPRYVALATLAGVAYGWVYQRTGKITAAAVTHALVDAAWVVLLRR